MVDCWPVPMKKAYSPGFMSAVEFELVGPDPSMLRSEGDLLLALDARFAAGDATEASYLELPPVTFLFEDDQGEIGGAAAVGDVNIEDGDDGR